MTAINQQSTQQQLLAGTLNWNAPLPKGGVAVANEVTLIFELELAHA